MIISMLGELWGKHKPWLGYPLAAVFALLWWNKACPTVEAVPVVTATQSQAVTQTAKATVRVQLVYRDRLVEVPGEAPRPLPCPDVSIEADSGSEATHWQSQSLTVTPQIVPQTVNSAIFLGGGYLDGPILAGGYRRDILTLQVVGWTDKIGGLATVDLIRFK